jgi:hypothetical protein
MVHELAELKTHDATFVDAPSRIRPICGKTLLYPGLIIPLTLMGLVSDQVFLGGTLRKKLPRDPESLTIFSFFFVYPHIIASLCVAANSRIRSQLTPLLAKTGTFAILLCLMIALAKGKSAVFIFYGLATIYHVFAQQFGLARIFLPKTNWHFRISFASGFLLTVLCYALVYYPNSGIQAYKTPLAAIAMAVATVSLPSFCVLFGSALSSEGRWYLIMCLLTPLSSWLCVTFDFPFGAILIPRVIHDVTAFLFYVSYETNSPTQTIIEKAAGLTTERGSLLRAAPIVAISLMLASFLTAISRDGFGVYVATTIGFLHYVLEHFLWRSSSPAREFVKITA